MRDGDALLSALPAHAPRVDPTHIDGPAFDDDADQEPTERHALRTHHATERVTAEGRQTRRPLWNDPCVAARVGDRVSVFGGYEHQPAWLSGRAGVSGLVVKWIPSEGSEPSCVVRLDEPLTAEGDVRGTREVVTGRFLVLGLRYRGQTWESSGTAHVELCSAEPESKPWGDRAVGAWVESHATYEVAP
jgi:hypothetical protein